MSPLKFDVHASSSEFAAARLGRLSISKADQHGTDQTGTKRVIETPGCFMNSIKGSVPHLTPDNLRLQDYGGISVFLEQILYGQGALCEMFCCNEQVVYLDHSSILT
jgi:hypothetical protein